MDTRESVARRVSRGVRRGETLSITIDGRRVDAYAGETLAAVMIAEGEWPFGPQRAPEGRRGLFCGIGICYECLVTVNGHPSVRACATLVEDGMDVVTAYVSDRVLPADGGRG